MACAPEGWSKNTFQQGSGQEDKLEVPCVGTVCIAFILHYACLIPTQNQINVESLKIKIQKEQKEVSYHVALTKQY